MIRDKRILIVLTLLCIMGVAIIGRLVSLQIFQFGFYAALASGQQTVSADAQGQRGNIYLTDKNGNLYLAATTRDVPYVFASPGLITHPNTAAQTVASILGLSSSDLLSKFKNTSSFHVILKEPITDQEKLAIEKAGIKGIYVGTQKQRYYPLGSTAAQVLGFVNKNGQGQYGVEQYYNSYLEGQNNAQTLTQNPAGYLLSLFHNNGSDGSDLLLTLDINIQSYAETLLQDAQKKLDFKEGTIIVMNPSTGKLLALANTPTFNPNHYDQVHNLGVFLDPAVSEVYEPGSVFKSVTMAGAVQEGAVTPQTTYVDSGTAVLSGSTIHNYNHHVWGKRSMTEVLEYSINTGAVFAEQQLGNNLFMKYVTKFGFLQPTHVDLAGELFSPNTDLQNGRAINYATAAFGQGINVTAMQMIQAYTALANNGTMTPPFIGNEYRSPGGQWQPLSHPQQKPQQVVSSDTAAKLSSMLTSVVQYGYAKGAQLPGYYVAGKTGTAQVAWSAIGVQKPGYSKETIQSFIGYAPAFHPKVLILVKLSDPKTPNAEESAIPIFHKLLQYTLNYYEIPPDHQAQ